MVLFRLSISRHLRRQLSIGRHKAWPTVSFIEYEDSSAIIKLIEKNGANAAKTVGEYVKEMKTAISS